ncbi:hypothetical protein D9757_001647 [Collybiopsis confluens]|uniref:Uncharacterized protein n=1 Tax=Collybiopsis confluens TaxID=2823264 RepID=A0A8H5HZ30_9AGAR|nr:hypothetical protein D9757_001647 [Collybiopsis confluens]
MDSDIAPISAIVQYIQHIPLILSYTAQTARKFGLFASWLIRSTLSYPTFLVLSPLAHILSITFYILGPFIVFGQILLDALLLTPFNILLYLLDAVYPLYVFFGVACITGTIVGLLARQLVVQINKLATLDSTQEWSGNRRNEQQAALGFALPVPSTSTRYDQKVPELFAGYLERR